MREIYKKEIKPIPETEYGERIENLTMPSKIVACENHKKNWMEGTYELGKDNSITCKECGWGAYIPGYMRLVEGKLVDLRTLTSAT